MKIALIIERMDTFRGGRERSLAQIAVELAKRSLYNGLYNTLEQQLYVEGDAQRLCARSSDHKEAIKAYLEKRDPVFKGL